MKERDDLLTRAQAAKYLGVSVSWLQTHTQDGPTTTRMGRKVFYLQADLDAYIQSRRGRGTTQAVARQSRKNEVERDRTRSVPTMRADRATPRGNLDVSGAFAAMQIQDGAAKVENPAPPAAAVKPKSTTRGVSTGPTTRAMGTQTLQTLLQSSRDVPAPATRAMGVQTLNNLRQNSRDVASPTPVPERLPKPSRQATGQVPVPERLPTPPRKAASPAPPPLPQRGKGGAPPALPRPGRKSD